MGYTRHWLVVGLLAAVLLLIGAALRAPWQVVAIPATQPTALTALHRSGQTFLTWQEQPGTGVRYRVYRHHAAIDATNLAQATLLYADVPQDSARFYANRYNVQSSGVWDERYVERFVIEEGAAPLAAGLGLLVWTLAPVDFAGAQGGSGYYAVTTVTDGIENRTEFGTGNTTGPVAEQVADPLPVEISVDAIDPGGHIFIQYMSLRDWNVTFHAPNPGNGFYGLGAAASADAIQYAYDYAVYAPSAAECGGALPATVPVVVSLHGWDGNSYAPRTADPDPYGWCVYRIYPIDQSETWWFGFARTHDYRVSDMPATGDTIVNYTEQRVLRMVYDLLRDPPGPAADADRVFVFGGSMGASGTLAFALRYPNVFAAAYAGQPMTDYATSGDGGGVDWRPDVEPKWGAVADNLPVSSRAPGGWGAALQAYNGTSVWSWQNHQAQLVARRGRDATPLGIAHGVEDDVIEWSTQGQPVYPALNSSRQVWGGAAVAGGHSWTGFGGSLYNLDLDTRPGGALVPFFRFLPVRNETVPGLSNGSTNAALPPTGLGAYNLAVRWSASWDAWDGAPVDTSTQWAMSFCYQEVDRYSNECGSGQPLTVDITPRRTQHFVRAAGARYRWENRRVRDGLLVDSGVVTADSDGLITVPAFALNDPDGNRLILAPTGDLPTARVAYLPVVQAAAATATPTATPTAVVRTWPDTRDGIHVFNDQLLPTLSDAQWQFAATHYAGVQKMTRPDADTLRSYNPDLLILHYRLGLALGYRAIENGCQPAGEYVRVVEGAAWVQEWPGEAVVQEDWFAHWPESSASRVLNCDWGWWLMNLESPGWRAYWQGEVLRQLQANANDGVFIDSLSVPNYLGSDRYDPALPPFDLTYENTWASRIDAWLAWLQTQPVGDYALVPNVGNWVTTRDPTTYAAVDGAMFEGFAMWGAGAPYAVEDWRLQMNRALGLIRQGKAVIAQAYTGDGRERLFALGSYLLIKGDRTYLNLESEMAPEWWPEYDIAIGTPLQPPVAAIDDLASDAVYRRDFTNGFVLVNPAEEGDPIVVNLGGTLWQVQPEGGGPVGADGVPTGSLTVQSVTTVSLPPYSAAVLLQRAPDGQAGER
ncbi:MAG: putative glycoside hydrolase [Caldilinea sp.]